MTKTFKDNAFLRMAAERFEFARNHAQDESDKRAIAFEIAGMCVSYHKGSSYTKASHPNNTPDTYQDHYIAQLSLYAYGRDFLRVFTDEQALPNADRIYDMMKGIQNV